MSVGRRCVEALVRVTWRTLSLHMCIDEDWRMVGGGESCQTDFGVVWQRDGVVLGKIFLALNLRRASTLLSLS